MRCALINSDSRAVITIIVADPATDKVSSGFELVAAPDDVPVGEGWLYSRDRGFVMGPELKAKIEAERLAVWNHPDAVLIRSIERDPDGFLERMESGNG